jgi:hypothetical protein
MIWKEKFQTYQSINKAELSEQKFLNYILTRLIYRIFSTTLKDTHILSHQNIIEIIFHHHLKSIILRLKFTVLLLFIVHRQFTLLLHQISLPHTTRILIETTPQKKLLYQHHLLKLFKLNLIFMNSLYLTKEEMSDQQVNLKKENRNHRRNRKQW